MSGQYGAETTTDELLEGRELAGTRFLVTGASAGLGVETIRTLAAHGASVVGAARDLAKARRALEATLASPAGTGVELVELDLASLASVRAAADDLVARGRPFDAIITNAGVMACPFGRTADGFETQFGTNHLGHFVLVNRLLPLLASPGRVVVLSSSAHRGGDVDLEDPNFEHAEYSPWKAYSQSKTANALFAVALDRRLRGGGARACAVHPGVIPTELGRHLDMTAGRPSPPAGTQFVFKTIPQGAATSVWCAVVAPADAIGGKFCQDCGVAPIDDSDDRSGGVRSYALDPARAEALWAKSEDLVGERFPLAVAA